MLKTMNNVSKVQNGRHGEVFQWSNEAKDRNDGWWEKMSSHEQF